MFLFSNDTEYHNYSKLALSPPSRPRFCPCPSEEGSLPFRFLHRHKHTGLTINTFLIVISIKLTLFLSSYRRRSSRGCVQSVNQKSLIFVNIPQHTLKFVAQALPKRLGEGSAQQKARPWAQAGPCWCRRRPCKL